MSLDRLLLLLNDRFCKVDLFFQNLLRNRLIRFLADVCLHLPFLLIRGLRGPIAGLALRLGPRFGDPR